MMHQQPHAVWRGQRVVHNRYGRGRIEALYITDGQARVQIDGEVCARRLCLRDMVLEPVGMPKARPELRVVRT